MAVAFKGADDTPYTKNWNIFGEYTPDYALDASNSLMTLRARSQQLIRDNPIVSGLQQAYVNSVCSYGPVIKSGSEIRLRAKKADAILAPLLASADLSGCISLTNLIETIVASSFSDGDILINLPLDSSKSGVQTVVELIEAFRVATPIEYTRYNKNDPMYGRVRHGVQYDAQGRVEGYWVLKANISDMNSTRFQVKDFDYYPMYRSAVGADGIEYRRRVTYLFKAPAGNRPLASRQYPLTAALITTLKNLDDFSEAVVIGARVAACFAAFVQTKNPNKAIASMTTDSEGNTTTTPDGTKRHARLQPGQIFYLNLNEEISFASPNKPSDNTDSFLLRNYKTISMSIRIPYILAFLDTEQVSYSSWRGAVLEAFKTVQRWRRELNSVIDWVVSTWLTEAMTLGLVNSTEANLKIRWPSVGVLDVEKEARGNKLELENGTKSRQMICDEQAIDYEVVQQERTEEALEAVELQAKILVRQKELEEEFGIEFIPEKETATSGGKNTKRRPGEKDDGGTVSDDDATERRKEDGNW